MAGGNTGGDPVGLESLGSGVDGPTSARLDAGELAGGMLAGGVGATGPQA
jgi:hypothetical protein